MNSTWIVRFIKEIDGVISETDLDTEDSLLAKEIYDFIEENYDQREIDVEEVINWAVYCLTLGEDHFCFDKDNMCFSFYDLEKIVELEMKTEGASKNKNEDDIFELLANNPEGYYRKYPQSCIGKYYDFKIEVRSLQ